MIIKNARVFTEDGSFMQGDVVVRDGCFDSVLERTADTDAANDSELICVMAPQRRLM